jgi:hypothetical protein
MEGVRGIKVRRRPGDSRTTGEPRRGRLNIGPEQGCMEHRVHTGVPTRQGKLEGNRVHNTGDGKGSNPTRHELTGLTGCTQLKVGSGQQDKVTFSEISRATVHVSVMLLLGLGIKQGSLGITHGSMQGVHKGVSRGTISGRDTRGKGSRGDRVRTGVQEERGLTGGCID